MRLIVGTGNPGARYEFTRHNIGFLAVDYIADKLNISLNKKRHKAILGKGNISEKDVIIAKPQTFMNLSGESVQSISDFFCIAHEDIIVIYDDIDLEFWTIRIRKKGGSGGHRGMQSIIEYLGTNDFSRIRLGIGRPENKAEGLRLKAEGDVVDYVLSSFNNEEEKKLPEIFERVNGAVEVILKDSVEKAMNKYNRS